VVRAIMERVTGAAGTGGRAPGRPEDARTGPVELVADLWTGARRGGGGLNLWALN